MSADLYQGFRLNTADLPSEAVIFGDTPAMREVHSKVERVLASDFPVLLRGESGTGKDLVARFLHNRSSRRDGPFVKLSCAAIPERFLEGELLGYEEDTFPGTIESKRGLIEIASGGTLFLDEIGEMGWTLQSRLLRLLQDGCYVRVGGFEECRTSARIICATNVDLAHAVKRGSFRQDLYDDLEVMSFRLSPLRERKEDIPQLWDFFAGKLARRFGKSSPQLTPAVLHVLEQWNWPGNLCELENCIARVLILGDEEVIGEELQRRTTVGNALGDQRSRSWHFRGMAAAETTILQVLQANHWNQRKTTEELKRSYRSLLYRLRNAGLLQRPRGRRGFPGPG
jgi:DNA-binding NtrC family response regulator